MAKVLAVPSSWRALKKKKNEYLFQFFTPTETGKIPEKNVCPYILCHASSKENKILNGVIRKSLLNVKPANWPLKSGRGRRPARLACAPAGRVAEPPRHGPQPHAMKALKPITRPLGLFVVLVCTPLLLFTAGRSSPPPALSTKSKHRGQHLGPHL